MSPEALCLSYAPLLPSPSTAALPYPSAVLGAAAVAPHWVDAPLSLCHRVQRVQHRNPRPFNLTAMGVPHSNTLACASVVKQCNLQEELCVCVGWGGGGVEDVQLDSPNRHDSRHRWPHVRWQDHRASLPAPTGKLGWESTSRAKCVATSTISKMMRFWSCSSRTQSQGSMSLL
uniref:Uncharacterized protein n=1 Tax=Triticum urartu TaxID=4572 RepID=A0A8R7TID8_TRIUA